MKVQGRGRGRQGGGRASSGRAERIATGGVAVGARGDRQASRRGGPWGGAVQIPQIGSGASDSLAISGGV